MRFSFPLGVLLATVLLAGCGLLTKPGEAVVDTPSFELQIHARPKKAQELLEAHLELNRYRKLQGLHRQELTRLISVAEMDIRKLLATLGYFAPTVQLQLHNPPKDASDLPIVRIEVDAGERTTVTAVDIQVSSPQDGEEAGRWQRQAVQRNWSLEVGQAFSQDDWASAKAEGLRRLQARRYPMAQLVSSRADIDADTQQAQLQAHYATGPLVRFGPLEIEGGQRYDTAAVTRAARLPVGREYRQSTLLDVQQRMAATGLYDSVFLTLQTEQLPADLGLEQAQAQAQVQVPVLAHVREAPLQKWVYGVGLSTDTGPRLSIDHTHNRVPHLGWQAQSKLQLNRKNPLLSTRLYSLPDGSGWNWFTSIQLERAELADYQANSIALSAGRGKNEDKIDRQYFLRYDLANPQSSAQGSAQGYDAPPKSSALSANYSWTGRYFNNPTNPTRGYGLAFELGVGTTLTPQRTPFTRALGRWQYFQPMGERGVLTHRRARLALRAQAGAVTAHKGADIPLTQLFLSGGDTTVRGYGYQSIGTRTDNAQRIGGRYMLAGGAEWQRPIVLAGERRDWEHTVFIDAGSVFDDWGQGAQVFVGAGSGIRWNSPVGPLQADLAYGFKTQEIRLHLRLGFTF